MRVFVAGATGATGQVLVPLLAAAGHDLVLHVRPKTASEHPMGRDPRARVFDLSDAAALREAMIGCDAVVSLVGTMKKRFAAGDTYESADIGSTRQLVEGAKAAGVRRFLLLSSLGAGGAGAYLKAKGECERIVRESGLRWTVFQPSALVSPADGAVGHHGKREVPGFFVRAAGMFGGIGLADDWRPIPLEVLCGAMARVLAEPRDGAVLTGRDLWRMA